MGAGRFIAGLGSTVGIILIILGALISLTGIGAIIGIPLIIIGLLAIFTGAAGGAAVGTTKAAYDVSKEIRGVKSKSSRYCVECGDKITFHSRFCSVCGKRQ